MSVVARTEYECLKSEYNKLVGKYNGLLDDFNGLKTTINDSNTTVNDIKTVLANAHQEVLNKIPTEVNIEDLKNLIVQQHAEVLNTLPSDVRDMAEQKLNALIDQLTHMNLDMDEMKEMFSINHNEIMKLITSLDIAPSTVSETQTLIDALGQKQDETSSKLLDMLGQKQDENLTKIVQTGQENAAKLLDTFNQKHNELVSALEQKNGTETIINELTRRHDEIVNLLSTMNSQPNISGGNNVPIDNDYLREIKFLIIKNQQEVLQKIPKETNYDCFKEIKQLISTTSQKDTPPPQINEILSKNDEIRTLLMQQHGDLMYKIATAPSTEQYKQLLDAVSEIQTKLPTAGVVENPTVGVRDLLENHISKLENLFSASNSSAASVVELQALMAQHHQELMNTLSSSNVSGNSELRDLLVQNQKEVLNAIGDNSTLKSALQMHQEAIMKAIASTPIPQTDVSQIKEIMNAQKDEIVNSMKNSSVGYDTISQILNDHHNSIKSLVCDTSSLQNLLVKQQSELVGALQTGNKDIQQMLLEHCTALKATGTQAHANVKEAIAIQQKTLQDLLVSQLAELATPQKEMKDLLVQHHSNLSKMISNATSIESLRELLSQHQMELSKLVGSSGGGDIAETLKQQHTALQNLFKDANETNKNVIQVAIKTGMKDIADSAKPRDLSETVAAAVKSSVSDIHSALKDHHAEFTKTIENTRSKTDLSVALKEHHVALAGTLMKNDGEIRDLFKKSLATNSELVAKTSLETQSKLKEIINSVPSAHDEITKMWNEIRVLMKRNHEEVLSYSTEDLKNIREIRNLLVQHQKDVVSKLPTSDELREIKNILTNEHSNLLVNVKNEVEKMAEPMTEILNKQDMLMNRKMPRPKITINSVAGLMALMKHPLHKLSTQMPAATVKDYVDAVPLGAVAAVATTTPPPAVMPAKRFRMRI